MNLNKLFNSVADEQGVEPGTKEWKDGGIMPFSGTTGGHAAYGWKHEHKLSPSWVRAVIANYGHRRCYYDNEPKRSIGYNDAGRPIGWEPEDELDLADGKVGYLTSNGLVKVSGPDPLHFHIGPLLEIFDKGAEYQIKAQGKKLAGSYVAGVMVQYIMNSLAGMVNNNYSSFGTRGLANVVKAIAGAQARGLIFEEDNIVFQKWLTSTFMDVTSKAPGHGYLSKDLYSKPSKKTWQLYNGLFWQIPSIYDLYILLPDSSSLRRELGSILNRQCSWLKELVVQKGDIKIRAVTISDNIEELEFPPEVLMDYVTYVDEGVFWHQEYSFRALSVAAHFLDDSTLKQIEEKVVSEHKGKSDRKWFVDHKGDYLF